MDKFKKKVFLMLEYVQYIISLLLFIKNSMFENHQIYKYKNSTLINEKMKYCFSWKSNVIEISL